MNRFRFNVAPEHGQAKVNFDAERAQECVKTILVRGLNSDLTRVQLEEFLAGLVGEKPAFLALYGKNILKPANEIGADFDAAMAAVEFGSRSLMLRALLAIRAAPADLLVNIAAPGRFLLYLFLHFIVSLPCLEWTRLGRLWTRM